MIKDGWYFCPFCRKKLFPVLEHTRVCALPQKCKACKHIFEVNI